MEVGGGQWIVGSGEWAVGSSYTAISKFVSRSPTNVRLVPGRG